MAVRTRNASRELRDTRRVSGASPLIGLPSYDTRTTVCERDKHCRVAGLVHGRDLFTAYGAAMRNSTTNDVRGAAGSILSQ